MKNIDENIYKKAQLVLSQYHRLKLDAKSILDQIFKASTNLANKDNDAANIENVLRKHDILFKYQSSTQTFRLTINESDDYAILITPNLFCATMPGAFIVKVDIFDRYVAESPYTHAKYSYSAPLFSFNARDCENYLPAIKEAVTALKHAYNLIQNKREEGLEFVKVPPMIMCELMRLMVADKKPRENNFDWNETEYYHIYPAKETGNQEYVMTVDLSHYMVNISLRVDFNMSNYKDALEKFHNVRKILCKKLPSTYTSHFFGKSITELSYQKNAADWVVNVQPRERVSQIVEKIDIPDGFPISKNHHNIAKLLQFLNQSGISYRVTSDNEIIIFFKNNSNYILVWNKKTHEIHDEKYKIRDGVVTRHKLTRSTAGFEIKELITLLKAAINYGIFNECVKMQPFITTYIQEVARRIIPDGTPYQLSQIWKSNEQELTFSVRLPNNGVINFSKNLKSLYTLGRQSTQKHLLKALVEADTMYPCVSVVTNWRRHIDFPIERSSVFFSSDRLRSLAYEYTCMIDNFSR